MRERSFHDILLKKIQQQEARPKSTVFESRFFVAEAATIPLTPSLSLSLEQKIKQTFSVASKYTRKISKTPRPTSTNAPVEPQEHWYLKKDLPPETQKQWQSFEEMVGLSLGEKTTSAIVRSTFRQFVKRIRPDLNKSSAKYNFSQLVKAKDLFLKALELNKVETAPKK
jgi:hypothetical protein